MPTVYIGMGANLPSPSGEPEATLAAAVDRLATLGRVTARSSLYSTAPVGLADQPRFVNAAVALATELAPPALLEQLLRIEREFGRDRSSGVQNGPRTLDLDILLYDDLAIRAPGLEIPHPRLAERAFVLVPLAEIASNHIVVTRRSTVTQLLHSLRSGLPAEKDELRPIQSALWRPGVVRDSPADGRADAAPDADG